MILNKRQYNVTKNSIAQFIESLNELKNQPLPEDTNGKLRLKYQIEAVEGQLETLKQEVQEYEQLKSGQAQILVSSFESLPETLIKARIIRGLSQAQLAEKLKVKQQQVQKDEANLYAHSSYSKLIKVKDALNLNIVEEVTLQ